MAETKSKPTAQKAVSPETSANKKPASRKINPRVKKAVTAIGDQARYEMIQYAAYFIAERNSFAGDPQAFWAEAEAQINGMISRQ